MKSENPRSTESEIRRAMVEQAFKRLESAAGRQVEVFGLEAGVIVNPLDLRVVLATVYRQQDEWREVVERLKRAEAAITATGVSADPGGTETKPEQNLHEKGSEG